MKLYENHAQLVADSPKCGPNWHMPPVGDYLWRCDRCGKAAPRSEPCGITRAGFFHCYGCCHATDLEEMEKHAGPFVCYVSSDGRRVSNWPGGSLGTIVGYGESRAGWNGSTVARFRVLDPFGRWWTGRGAGRGIVCTLRPMRDPTEPRGPRGASCLIDVYSPWGTGRWAYRVMRGRDVLASEILPDGGASAARDAAFKKARALGFAWWRQYQSNSKARRAIPTV